MRGRLPATSVPDVVVDGGWGMGHRANESGPKSTLITLITPIKDSKSGKKRNCVEEKTACGAYSEEQVPEK